MKIFQRYRNKNGNDSKTGKEEGNKPAAPTPSPNAKKSGDDSKSSDKADAASHGDHGGVDGDKTPKADVILPKKERRSSFVRRTNHVQIHDLPKLIDSPPGKRDSLYIQKLQLCSIVLIFDTSPGDGSPSDVEDFEGKEIKKRTLQELVQYLESPGGQKMATAEEAIRELVECVKANIFRPLPPQSETFDPDEDEPNLDPSWIHLQLVYELFFKFLIIAELPLKTAKKYINQDFVKNLVDLFESEDPRERDYLKTSLHKIYGRFMSLRSFIRKHIKNCFFHMAYCAKFDWNVRHHGIAELLEILGSIINGFTTPLRQEHLEFLESALLPLHRPPLCSVYFNQLSYCISLYIEKDLRTGQMILSSLIHTYWPWQSSSKQVLFLTELEQLLELIPVSQLNEWVDVHGDLVRLIAACLNSDHFQVTERTLLLWNSSILVNSQGGFLSPTYASDLLPFIAGSLTKIAQHWNPTVQSYAQNVVKIYMDSDLGLFERCLRGQESSERNEKTRTEALVDQLTNLKNMGNAVEDGDSRMVSEFSEMSISRLESAVTNGLMQKGSMTAFAFLAAASSGGGGGDDEGR